MSDTQHMINWKSVFKQSNSFNNDDKPFKFTFIEELFERDFYNRLCDTFPKVDDKWLDASTKDKTKLKRKWGNVKLSDIVPPGDDHSFSEEWNTLKRYFESEEFFENIRNFSGVPVNRLKYFGFSVYHKGDFQLSHIHNVGPSTLILLIYFTKGWKKGEPGGTYVAENLEDESSIIFEAYNLDNSMTIMHDGPKAIHGVRTMTSDTERRSIELYLEMYSEQSGWSGFTDLSEQEKKELPTI